MSVAEKREALRAKPHRQIDGLFNAAHALQGKAVHQIEIDAADAGAAQVGHGAFDDGIRLDAIDRCLYARVEILHAETDAVDAKTGEFEGHIFGHEAGVGLEGDLRVRG